MNTSRTTLALLLVAPLALTFAGCDKLGGKSSGGDTVASATATATAPAGPSCPSGSTLDGSNCKASGQSRVATITWAGAVGDTGPTLTVKNTSSVGLKSATVSLWFYDRSGKRLDVAGSKKWTSAGDALGGALAAGASKDTTFGFSKDNIPTGAAEIEGEVVQATLQKTDGSEGPAWKNDDLKTDERAMTGTPPAAAATAVFAAGPRATTTAPGTPTAAGKPPTTATASPTGHHPGPPPPPPHGR